MTTAEKLATLRASMAARGDVTPYSEIRAPLLNLTEEELFAPSEAATREGKRAAREADFAAIQAALVASDGNTAAAARALGVPRATLDKRITSLGLRSWLAETYPALRRPQK